MDRPVMIVENFFSTIQFPNHTVSAEEEASGNEVTQLANGRRSQFNYWTPTTENSSTWVKAQCNRLRYADCIAIDRGHTLAGKTVTLEVSDDDFTTTETVFSITFPSLSAAGDIDDSLGVVTEEGAWIKRFPGRAGIYWRLTIGAVASYKPQIVGLWLGLSWSPARLFDTPWSEDGGNVVAKIANSDAGWQGSNQVTVRREGNISLRLESMVEYDVTRYHIAHYERRRPMWICFDGAQADRTVLAIRPPGRMGFEYRRDWWRLRQASISWQEREPKADS